MRRTRKRPGVTAMAVCCVVLAAGSAGAIGNSPPGGPAKASSVESTTRYPAKPGCLTSIKRVGADTRLRAACRTMYRSTSVYLARRSLEVLIRGERSQRIRNPVGQRVGTIRRDGHPVGGCVITKTANLSLRDPLSKGIKCVRNGASSFSRKFTIGVRVRLTPVKPRGCPKLDADPWDLQTTANRRPNGGKGRTFYIYGTFRYTWCR